jgi:2-polyprenyl-3-methyl-5-hydroxy-6-metoxy-1,4-benzoquinol methylase
VSTPGAAARDGVDRVLAACGGGAVIVTGPHATETVAAWRRRGVLARVASDVGAQVPADLVWIGGLLGVPDPVTAAARLADASRWSPRAVVLAVTDGSREPWERFVLAHGWRKHPLYQQVTDYAALEEESAPLILIEPVPAGASRGAALADLAAARDLHMDMLREAGRRADAHVARYMWARRFVRPGDRVLDAACGLGYGSRVLADGTLAESVHGVDVDPEAIAYAAEHYGADRSRLTFAAHDVASLGDLAAASFDVIVSFETVEHLPDPERFLADGRRLLTPGGRFLCSIPNEWLDERGVDPNPHHLHVFDRRRLEALCRRHFMLEATFGQTAGGGMRLSGAPRALWDADTRAGDAEWWLAVGMTAPLGAVADPVSTRWQPDGDGAIPPVVDFARHYQHPWIVRAMVSMGLRTDSPALREELAAIVSAAASPFSADRGAALCVGAYAQWASPAGLRPETLRAIDAYCARPAGNPHAARWHVSLHFVRGVAALDAGDRDGAVRALTTCAEADPLVFSPLLATKSVSACWLLGWNSLQEHDVASAARWWRAGIDHAERALHRPWSEMMGDRDRPLLFGLRETAQVVDLASQCAAGLHLLPHAAERPGLVASQVAESMAGRLERQAHAMAGLAQAARALQEEAATAWQRCQAAEREADALRQRLRDTETLATLVEPLAERRVAIFGTGLAGRQALVRLRRIGAHVDCFADNDRGRWGQAVEEVPVVDPGTLRARGVTFVAVASLPGRDAIRAQLTSFGFREGHDFVTVA